MKKLIFKTLLLVGFLGAVISCSSDDDMAFNQEHSQAQNSKESQTAKTQTYDIRFGLLSQNGTKILSGSYDLGGFVATNTVTGEEYYTYGGGGFQSVPQYFEGLPAGTYEFSAQQGQGGWVGYGSVIGTVSDAQIDEDGYVTVYVPIAWEE